jgi:hypothetical protein
VLGVCLLVGCRDRGRDPADVAVAGPVERKPALEVGVSGCSGLVQDPERGLVCLTRKQKPLYLWLDGATDPKLALRFDGVEIATTTTVDPDGVLVFAALPEQQGRLELETDAGAWTMTLVAVSDRFEVLRKDVQASWKAGDAEAALAQLERAQAELESHEAVLLRCGVAQVVLAAGDHDQVLSIAQRVSSASTLSGVGTASLLAADVQI